MQYRRMIMEVESPEEIGYDLVRYNLAESSMADRSLGDLAHGLDDLLLSYGDHRGRQDLREEIVAASGGGFSPDDVLVSVGAAGALFTVATTLLSPVDRLLVTRPNYASNLETPRAIGADIAILELSLADGFRLNLKAIQHLITPSTKLISVTSPHNPTGVVIPWADLEELANMAKRAEAYLLVDETYRDLTLSPAPLAASLGSHVISVSSLSKTYGVPGLRVGWLICRDQLVTTRFLAAKEQIALAHSVVDEALALKLMRRRHKLMPEILQRVMDHRELVEQWLRGERRLSWVKPEGGVVCFPRIIEEGIDPSAFYQVLNERYQTWVGPGHWFEQDPRHFRLGFGYPSTDDLRTGLLNISRALDDSTAGGE